jgi:hypothetical protein
MTVDAGAVVRTRTGNINFGPANQLNTESVINNGTLKSAAAGPEAGNFRTLTLTNVTNHGTVAAEAGRLTAYNFTSDGTIDLAGRGAGTLATAPDSSIDKLVNSGNMTLHDGALLLLRGLNNSGTIQVNSGARLAMYADSFFYGSLPLTNTGTISFDNAELELGIPMASDQVDVAFNRTGTKSLIVNAAMDNTGRTINVSPTNKLFVGSIGKILGGRIAGTPGGLVTPTGAENWGTFDGVTLAADWTVDPARTAPRITNNLVLDANPTVTLDGSLSFTPAAAAQSVTGTGRFVFNGDDPFTPAGMTGEDLTLGAGITVETGQGDGLIGTRSPRSTPKLLSAGTLRVTAGRHLFLNSATVTNTGLIDLVGSGQVLAQASVVNTGTIRGQGSIFATSLTSAGTIDVSPGQSPGVIFVDANVALDGASLLRLDIGDGSAKAVPNDRFAVDGTLGLAGTLHVDLLDGFVPSPGATFQLFSSTGALSGSFATLQLPPLPADRAWDDSNLSAGWLAVVPEPAAVAPIVGVVTFLLRGRRRRCRS